MHNKKINVVWKDTGMSRCMDKRVHYALFTKYYLGQESDIIDKK